MNLKLIKENVNKVVELCEYLDIKIAAVTKLICGNPQIVEVLVESGIEMLSDARIENIKKYKHINIPKMMIRLPMRSQVDQVVEFCNVSLVSDLEMMRLLSESALKRHTIHDVIVMIDMGDLREGIFYEDNIHTTINRARDLSGIRIIGIGTNLSCYGGVMPTQEVLENLVALKETLNNNYGLDMKIVSGGNSGTLSLLMNEGKLPKGINQLRLGASLFMGIGLNDEPIEGLNHNAFRLVCEVIEVKKKPSVPVGKIGLDAFGNKPVFEDKGDIVRCICGIGKQDVSPSNLIPIDKDIVILGGSSDHLILDVTQSKTDYQIGDDMVFELTYGGCLSLMTSDYVQKRLLYAE
ncbi:alanine racemase [Anaeromicrobium sediminis]|uniref:Alanine racemase n=2 Tax=Anaeromicrobium sediminis TaxID=1478221 RepID=A0A267MN57_9FIRM|nr:alanine racemase [Anaeromicrobium sediminis]